MYNQINSASKWIHFMYSLLCDSQNRIHYSVTMPIIWNMGKGPSVFNKLPLQKSTSKNHQHFIIRVSSSLQICNRRPSFSAFGVTCSEFKQAVLGFNPNTVSWFTKKRKRNPGYHNMMQYFTIHQQIIPISDQASSYHDHIVP